jgi:UDP-2-acetamido-3-amino-2,3-dideoxy-glucuronate N-acetyltransferase
MQSVPRVAVVGCGYWGKNLVRNFHSLGALAALCDVDRARLDAMNKEYRVRVTNDIDELLSMSEIDAVAIAAPAVQHFEVAKKALLAGKDVFVEKPLALRLGDGEELVALANKQSRILMVGHLLRYHPAILELDRLVRSGDLGKIEYISSSRLNLGKVRTEEDILWSFAPHDLSVILFLLREEPVSVTAHGASYLNHGISDVTLSILNFQSGVKAHVFVSWLHPFKEQKLVVVGDRQMAVFDDTEPEHKLALYPYRIDWVDRTPVAQKAEGRALSFSKSEPLQLECNHFLECVRDRTVPWTDGYSGLEVLKVLRACDDSIKNKGQQISCASIIEPKKSPYFVHPSSIVDEGCQIGEGTTIWHFSHITAGSRIGRECHLGQNVYVAPGVRVGNNVKIQNNVSLYTGVELEDDVFCGPSMVFTNVINPRSHISRKHEYRRTLVQRGASIGANAVIICGATLGRYSFVAAGAVVTKDVPDNALMIGVPAVRVGWMCQCGVRLPEGINVATCGACGQGYRLEDNACHEQTAADRVFVSAAA